MNTPENPRRAWGPDQLTLPISPIHAPVMPKGATIAERFGAFHQHNPHVYRAFRSLANQLRDAGVSKGSSKLIIERLRWEYTLRTAGVEKFKISNDYTALYARLLVYREPKFLGWFQLKALSYEFDPGILSD